VGFSTLLRVPFIPDVFPGNASGDGKRAESKLAPGVSTKSGEVEVQRTELLGAGGKLDCFVIVRAKSPFPYL
jgi:hypothetical protein